MDDLVLTAAGMPAIMVDGDRYPLCMTIAGMKEWAEHQGRTFDDVLTNGWMADQLETTDIHTLLAIALRGGERRRTLFSGEAAREITSELVDSVMDAFHPTELIHLLVRLWNEPPVRPPGPQTPAEQSPPGE